MRTWFTKNLGDAMLADEALDHIKTLFMSVCEKADNTKDMAIYSRHESEGHLHCEVKLYFSPETATVAKAVDATPCNKPSADGLDLLAGSAASWMMHFEESPSR